MDNGALPFKDTSGRWNQRARVSIGGHELVALVKQADY